MDAFKSRTRLTYRVLSAFIAFTFTFTSVIPPSYAQTIASLNLPVPGAMVGPSAAFVPVLLKGMTIHPDNPLQFDFIIDSGNTDFKEDQIKNESQRLVKYFLASMTIPKDDLWVNLSPYEKDRIIPEELGKTELGRDMLAQDYILKQLTASLMYPEKELGKEFWDKVYQKAREKYGTTEIPVDTFNKVWILPETATVYEHGQTVYIVEAKLRVMLDEDYQAREASLVKREAQTESRYASRDTRYESEIIREIILPEIEREVNEGQNFAPLRQIYHSLILAKWYKETIKNSLLSKIYVDQKKIAGVNLDDATLKDQIYAQYMEAYKKGVFNYIKEDYDWLSNEMIPRKYFSGGIKGDVAINRSGNLANIKEPTGAFRLSMRIDPQKKGKSSSPVSVNDLLNVPAGLIGALEEKGQILSVKAGEVFDINFVDYWNQIETFATEHPATTVFVSASYLFMAVGLGMMSVLFVMIMKEKYYKKYFNKEKVDSLVKTYGRGSIKSLLKSLYYIGSDDEQFSYVVNQLEGLGASSSELLEAYLHSPVYRQKILNLELTLDQDKEIAQSLLFKKLQYNFKGYYFHDDEAENIQLVWKRLGLDSMRLVDFYMSILISEKKDDYLKQRAAEALASLGDARAVGPLIERLSDSSSSVREAAAEALEKLGANKEQMVDGYLKALRSPNSDVRRAVAWHLGELKDTRAVEPLIQWLKDRDSYVRDNAAIALRKLGATKEQMVTGYLKTLESSDFNVRWSAVVALGKLKDLRAVGPLIERLSDSSSSVREAAAEALGELGDTRAVEPLLKRLKGSDSGVRGFTIEALGKLGDKMVVPTLIERLGDSDSNVRRTAVEALGKLGDSRVAEPLIQQLGDSDSDVRRSAAEVLGTLGDVRAVGPLIQRLGDGDSVFRRSAAEALGKLGDIRAVKPLEVLLSSTSRTVEVDYGYEQTGPYGDSWGWISDMRTENNPEYSAVETALQKLRSKFGGGASSSPLESSELDRGLAKKMTVDRKINLGDIKDERLRKFLIFLKKNNLTDVVVMGGAIKSILFNEEVADIDISVKTALTDEERAAFAPLAAAANERVYKNSLEGITQLAKAMGIDASAFLPPSRGVTKAFEGLNIDYFGPIQTDRGMVIKRSLFDAVTREGYFTNTAAGLLRFAIDAEGNIYGDTSALQDLLQGKLTIRGDGTNFGINDVLRVLRIKHQYGLQISKEDDRLLKNAVSRYQNQSLPPIVLEVARDQIQKLLASAVSKESAQQELEALGISSLIDKSRTTPQSSLPISRSTIALEDFPEGLKDKYWDVWPLEKLPDPKIFQHLKQLMAETESSYFRNNLRSLGEILLRVPKAREYFKSWESVVSPTSFLSADELSNFVLWHTDFRRIISFEILKGLRDFGVERISTISAGRQFLIQDLIVDLYLSKNKKIVLIEANPSLDPFLDDSKTIVNMNLETLSNYHRIELQEDGLGGISTIGSFAGSIRDLAGFIHSLDASLRSRAQSSSPVRQIDSNLARSRQDQRSWRMAEQQGQGSRVKGQGIASDEIRNTSDEVGGIDMNSIDLSREGAGVDIQFDPAELQEIIDAGIDGFAPVIINITPLPSVLPLLGLDPANKEEPLEVSVL